MALLAAMALLLAPVAEAQRTRLKPGWNMFSPQQDVEIGQKVSADAEQKLPMLNDARVDRYLDRLGKRLAAKAPGERFPYQFKAVNDMAINAFALPGGFMYVNRGTILAAETEAQLAGVMAHEIGHVALRHGTNQATKASFTQGLLGVLGATMGGNSVGAVAAQLGAGFVANSVLLKYSRDAETQSDVLATQMLYDNGYDPRGMSQFFEIINAQSKGGRPPEFFSSHPNPDNRAERVNKEIALLGGLPPNAKTDSAEFREIKRYVASLPPPPKKAATGTTGGTSGTSAGGRVPDPSASLKVFENSNLRLQHPDNWQAYSQGDAASFVPEGGVVEDRNGNQALAYGVMLNVFEPQRDRAGRITLEAATDQLIQELRQSNRNLRVLRRHERLTVGRQQRGLSNVLVNDSPLGGREIDWLVTVMRPEGVVYFVFVAPERDFDRYEAAFEQMVRSARFK
jgi:Zn-dependent protease with chaperone function